MILLLVAAVIVIRKWGLPRPFPWVWSTVLAAVFLAGAFTPLGTLERAVTFGAFLSVVVLAGQSARRLWRFAPWALAVLTVFLALDSLRILPGSDAFGGNAFWRRPGILENPNVTGAWALVLGGPLWSLPAVLISESRGALMGLFASLGLRTLPRRWWLALAVSGLLAAAILATVRPDTVAARIDLWLDCAGMAAAKPITGWGSGSLRTSALYHLSTFADAMNAHASGLRYPAHTAENAALTILVENGIAGLAVFIGFVVSLGVSIHKSQHPAKWGLLAFAIQQLVDDQWLHPVSVVLLGLAVAACLYAPRNAIAKS